MERLKSRYGLVGGCLGEVRPGPARFAGSRICRLEGREAERFWRRRSGAGSAGTRFRRIDARHRPGTRAGIPTRRLGEGRSCVQSGRWAVSPGGFTPQGAPQGAGGSAGAACVWGPGVRVGRREGAPRGARSFRESRRRRGPGDGSARSPLHHSLPAWAPATGRRSGGSGSLWWGRAAVVPRRPQM